MKAQLLHITTTRQKWREKFIIRRCEKKIAHFEKKVPNFGEKDRFFFQNVLAIFCRAGMTAFGRGSFIR